MKFWFHFFTRFKAFPPNLTLALQVHFDFQNFFPTKFCNFNILDLPSKHSGTKLKINFSQRREKSIPFSYPRTKWTSHEHCIYDLCATFSKTSSLLHLMIQKATNNVNFIRCSRMLCQAPRLRCVTKTKTKFTICG